MNTKSVTAILSAMAMVRLIVSPSSTGKAAALGSHFLTSTALYITMANLANDSIKAIITSGDWEFSGILDVSDFFGEGIWLITVQAHSLQEGGQLRLLNTDGS
jgi:hypothetical protein